MKNMIATYSVNAKEAFDREVKEIKRLLENIEAAIAKWEGLDRCHYGDVGHMAYINSKLGEINSFLGGDYV